MDDRVPETRNPGFGMTWSNGSKKKVSRTRLSFIFCQIFGAAKFQKMIKYAKKKLVKNEEKAWFNLP